MAGDNSPGMLASGTEGGAGDDGSSAAGAPPPAPGNPTVHGATSPPNPEVTAPQVVDLTDTDAAMVKLRILRILKRGTDMLALKETNKD